MQDKGLLTEERVIFTGHENEIAKKNLAYQHNYAYYNAPVNPQAQVYPQIAYPQPIYPQNPVYIQQNVGRHPLRQVCCPKARSTKVMCGLSVFFIMASIAFVSVRLAMNSCQFWNLSYQTCQFTGNDFYTCCYYSCNYNYLYCYSLAEMQDYGILVIINVCGAVCIGLSLLFVCVFRRMRQIEKDQDEEIGNPPTNYIRI